MEQSYRADKYFYENIHGRNTAAQPEWIKTNKEINSLCIRPQGEWLTKPLIKTDQTFFFFLFSQSLLLSIVETCFQNNVQQSSILLIKPHGIIRMRKKSSNWSLSFFNEMFWYSKYDYTMGIYIIKYCISVKTHYTCLCTLTVKLKY